MSTEKEASSFPVTLRKLRSLHWNFEVLLGKTKSQIFQVCLPVATLPQFYKHLISIKYVHSAEVCVYDSRSTSFVLGELLRRLLQSPSLQPAPPEAAPFDSWISFQPHRHPRHSCMPGSAARLHRTECQRRPFGNQRDLTQTWKGGRGSSNAPLPYAQGSRKNAPLKRQHREHPEAPFDNLQNENRLVSEHVQSFPPARAPHPRSELRAD